MDQVPRQLNNQPLVQTQQLSQTSLPQTAPVAQKPSSSGYFKRLYSGRMNRRNYIVGYLLLLGTIVCLLLLNSIISLIFPGQVTDLSLKPGAPLPQPGIGEKITSIVFILLIMIWLVFFIIYIFSYFIRRLHDLNKTGWFCLLNFVPFVSLLFHIYLLFFPGTAGENNYGAVPAPRINIKQDIIRLS
jgi:uncharacterized membrane protein YhaH (DUF805 family)